MLAAFLIVGAAFVMLFSSYGGMKLGKPDDEPEISKFSWFSMLFGAAIAAGIVFYGPAEPAYHYMTPPPFPLMFLLIVLVFGTFRGLRKYRENELEA